MGADKVTFWQGFLRTGLLLIHQETSGNVGSKSGNSLEEKKAKINPAYIWASRKNTCVHRINIRSKIIKVQLGAMRSAVYCTANYSPHPPPFCLFLSNLSLTLYEGAIGQHKKKTSSCDPLHACTRESTRNLC